MLNFYMDCGFDSEEEFFEYLNQLRDKALLQDDSDDVVSSFAQDLSASFIEVTESIEGSSLYVEYVSPEPLNQVRDGKGYSVEATIVSPSIDFFFPFYIEEDEEVDVYLFFIEELELVPRGQDIALKSGIDQESNSILSTLVFSNKDFWFDDTWLSTIPVGLPKHGLNLSETDLSEQKWVYRLFGKISGLVTANSASEAKQLFAQVLKESFTFIEGDVYVHHVLSDGQEKVISNESDWLIPIDHVFVNIRK